MLGHFAQRWKVIGAYPPHTPVFCKWQVASLFPSLLKNQLLEGGLSVAASPETPHGHSALNLLSPVSGVPPARRQVEVTKLCYMYSLSL
jgi:hypothetical protein